MSLEHKVNYFVAVDGCGVFRKVVRVRVAFCLQLISLVVRVHLLLAFTRVVSDSGTGCQYKVLL